VARVPPFDRGLDVGGSRNNGHPSSDDGRQLDTTQSISNGNSGSDAAVVGEGSNKHDTVSGGVGWMRSSGEVKPRPYLGVWGLGCRV
jgi:hypothetical protein